MDNGKAPAAVNTPPSAASSGAVAPLDDEETPKAVGSKQRRSFASPASPTPPPSGITGSLTSFIATSLRNLANTLSPESGPEVDGTRKLRQTATASTSSGSIPAVAIKPSLEQPAQIGGGLPKQRQDTGQIKRGGSQTDTPPSYLSMLPSFFGGKPGGRDGAGGVVPGGVILGSSRDGGVNDLSIHEASAEGQVFEDEMSSPTTKTVDLWPITPRTSTAGKTSSRASSLRLHDAVSAAPSRRTTLTPQDIAKDPTPRPSPMVTPSRRMEDEEEDEDDENVILDPISRAISTRQSQHFGTASASVSGRNAPPSPSHSRSVSLPFSSTSTSTIKPTRAPLKDGAPRPSLLTDKLYTESDVVASPFSYASSSSPATPKIQVTPEKPKKTLLSRFGLGKNTTHKRSGSTTSSAISLSPPSTPASPASPLPKSASAVTSLADLDTVGGGSTDDLRGSARPRYVKVRTKAKPRKELRYLFLAQELAIPSREAQRKDADTASIASNDDMPNQCEEPAPNKSKRRKKPAVWAMAFSYDGQYLAAAGQDSMVRIWQVNGSPPDRRNSVDSEAVSPGLPLSSPDPSSTAKTSKKRARLAEVPVFASKPIREYCGHTADILDLSWSKNNFLLSSSMDKTIRLWHVSRKDCLSAFLHLDVAVAVAFHPLDDRFFLSGSLDCKLRLWNVPDKRVHAWTELPELITSVAFANEGKLAVAGSFIGRCTFFEIETFRYNNQIVAKSGRGNAGKKVTAISSLPGSSSSGQEKILVTTNDSKMRLFNLFDRSCMAKYKGGHTNESSQIRGSFSEDGRYVITGSEDRGVYIYDSGIDQGGSFVGWLRGKEDRGGYETFSEETYAAESDITTCCIFAPRATRSVLAKTGDLIFSKSDGVLSRIASSASESDSTSSSQASSSIATKGLEDAVIVCADDHTGVIRIYRNSQLPAALSGSRRSSNLDRTRSRAESSVGVS